MLSKNCVWLSKISLSQNKFLFGFDFPFFVCLFVALYFQVLYLSFSCLFPSGGLHLNTQGSRVSLFSVFLSGAFWISLSFQNLGNKTANVTSVTSVTFTGLTPHFILLPTYSSACEIVPLGCSTSTSKI